jgi:NADH:ubiquinone oxidoreductase subunit K
MLLLAGLFGFLSSGSNAIVLLFSIEVLTSGVTLSLLDSSLLTDDYAGVIAVLINILLSGCDSAIGLALLVSHYNLRGNISLEI